jgi:hypothetical protein
MARGGLNLRFSLQINRRHAKTTSFGVFLATRHDLAAGAERVSMWGEGSSKGRYLASCAYKRLFVKMHGSLEWTIRCSMHFSIRAILGTP